MNLKLKPTSKLSSIKVGITLGDPSGIGPAITAKAVQKLAGLAEFVLIGDRRVFDRAKGPGLNVRFVDLNNVKHKNFKFGQIRAEYGRASIEYLDKALELLKEKEIDCLVTCPISKEAVSSAGYRHFSGHTEYLAARAGSKNFLMMLVNEYFKFALVTRHIPLERVSSGLSTEAIINAALLANDGLSKMFSLANPRIVVCGLNPHASDNGLLGSQENEVIKPAVERLRKKIRHLDGPMSADVAIYKAKNNTYDAVIAMYHDQALIPLKLSGGDSAVNMTLGLGFIRTSPLHGTAFDIAGNPDLADPRSLMSAIQLAIKCTSNLKRA